jgi:hypothetical protein
MNPIAINEMEIGLISKYISAPELYKIIVAGRNNVSRYFRRHTQQNQFCQPPTVPTAKI